MSGCEDAELWYSSDVYPQNAHGEAVYKQEHVYLQTECCPMVHNNISGEYTVGKYRNVKVELISVLDK